MGRVFSPLLLTYVFTIYHAQSMYHITLAVLGRPALNDLKCVIYLFIYQFISQPLHLWCG